MESREGNFVVVHLRYVRYSACSDVSLRMCCAGGAYEITHGRKYEGEGEESEF